MFWTTIKTEIATSFLITVNDKSYTGENFHGFRWSSTKLRKFFLLIFYKYCFEYWYICTKLLLFCEKQNHKFFPYIMMKCNKPWNFSSINFIIYGITIYGCSIDELMSRSYYFANLYTIIKTIYKIYSTCHLKCR